jgi:Protein of unknown function (DUF4232)
MGDAMRTVTMSSKVAALAAVTVFGGALLGACSSGPSTSSTTAATSTTRASVTTSRPSTSSTATSRPPTSNTAAGPSRCATASLSGSVVGSSGAAGTIETTFALASTSRSTCVLGGYPGLQLLSSTGTSLPTVVVRKGNYSFTAMSPTTVTLASGQSADFNVGYSDVPVGNETTCPSSASLEITPPNALDHLSVTATLAPCGGGTLVVSPVFAATGANNQAIAPSSG